MKILIVEDDQNKIKAIENYLKELIMDSKITLKKSYQSGLKEILSNQYDLIILDMTMPTFDRSPTESGGKVLKYAGMEILRKMIRKKVYTFCIVVTQFDTFGSKTLKELEKELEEKFKKNYCGTVSYNSISAIWKENLKDKIEELEFTEGDNRC